MPSSLRFDDHVGLVARSGGRLAELASAAGLDSPVPTCPTWTVAHLVAHQAMVHRWAASHLRGEGGDAPSQTSIRESEPDLLGYYRDGLGGLLDALRAASPDLTAMTFLADSGSPRDFWARRQAHETTIHMIDALAAGLGRVPTAGEAQVDPGAAVDGIDELLCGFFARGRSKLYDGNAYDFVVAPADSERRWYVHVAEKLTVSDTGSADASLTGTADQLYLGMWNRGVEVSASGRPDLLERWRQTQRIRWS